MVVGESGGVRGRRSRMAAVEDGGEGWWLNKTVVGESGGGREWTGRKRRWTWARRGETGKEGDVTVGEEKCR